MVRVREVSQGIKQGDLVGSWEVLGKPFSMGSQSRWLVVCRCECGRISAIRTSNLAADQTQCCGSCAKATHGRSRTPLYTIWSGMIHRCTKENNKRWDRYGGRGIQVCQEWLLSFEAFESWALAHGYQDGLQIDRERTDGHYEPGNCRWITCQENNNNRWNNRLLVAFGETKTMADWSRDARCVVCHNTLRNRIETMWNAVEAITTPKHGAYHKASA